MTLNLAKLTRSAQRVYTPAVLDRRSRDLRRLVVRGLAGGGRGHLGSALSAIEILRVLYDDILHVDAARPGWPDRDRCILSKGHGCLALYAVLADKGFFPAEELDRFCRFDGMLGGHPEAGKIPGVEASTGALGHGPSIGVGLALAARLAGRNSRIFVVTGDGEINEGSVWEAAMSAGKHGLDNYTVIVDYNKHQSYASTATVQDLEPLRDKWTSFGFSVRDVDGHSVDSLRRAFTDLPFATGKPNAVICHTIKGRGIGYAENDMAYHHKSKISDDEIERMLDAIEA